MSLGTLKFLRIVTPGVLILFFASLTGWITGLWNFSFNINQDSKQMIYSIPVLALGVIYYILAFRIQSNKKYFDMVSENIRSKLLQAAKIPDNPNLYTWQRVSGIFYPLIDGNPSLQVKARLAYANGYLWTTAADVRALSAIFALFPLVVFVINFVASGDLRPLWSVLFFIVLHLVSYPISNALTQRHMEIGDEQIEIIEHQHLAELQAKVGDIR